MAVPRNVGQGGRVGAGSLRRAPRFRRGGVFLFGRRSLGWAGHNNRTQQKGTRMMFHRMAASLFAAALLAPAGLVSAAWAQTPLRALPAETFKFLSAKEVDALTDKPGPGAKTAFPVDHENYYVEYAMRTDKGN